MLRWNIFGPYQPFKGTDIQIDLYQKMFLNSAQLN